MDRDLLVELDVDKEPYVKIFTDDKIINITGESGSREKLHVQ